MRRLPIQVADVVSVGYDVKTEVLEVEFRDGSLPSYLANQASALSMREINSELSNFLRVKLSSSPFGS